jgi:hypothetical protein
MKMYLLLFILLIVSGCSYKISRYDYIREPIKSNECEVIVCDTAVILGIENENIGQVELEPGGFNPFTKDSAIQVLKREACSVLANFVNIVGENISKQTRDKYHCIADLYKLDLDYIKSHRINVNNRDTLVYDLQRKLNWNDFRGRPQNTDTSDKKSFLFTTIMIEMTKVNVWLGYATYKCKGVFFRDVSWILSQYKNDSFLKYQQTLYDISELFALKLQKELNESKINLSRDKKITDIFNSYRDHMYSYQQEYIRETNQGEDLLAQENWNAKVNEELTSLQKIVK